MRLFYWNIQRAKREFAASCAAMKIVKCSDGTKEAVVAHQVYVIAATSQKGAEAKLLADWMEFYPRAEGWQNHSVLSVDTR